MLVVGLGNPGSRYAETRHNVGFRVVERFARGFGIALDEEAYGGRFGRGPVAVGDGPPLDVALLLPETFMNLSGDAVCAALDALGIDDPSSLLVVFDDVDLPFARLRVRRGGGPGGHRGMAHIIERLGRDDFPRLRFGVGRPEGAIDTSDWVLSGFSPEEARSLDGHLARAAEALEACLMFGVGTAMNRFNRDPEPAA